MAKEREVTMKHKRGKGRKPRRLQKVFKLKSGSGKFMLTGKPAGWGNQAMVPLAVKRAEWITKAYEDRMKARVKRARRGG